jgi:hypothetical protein
MCFLHCGAPTPRQVKGREGAMTDDDDDDDVVSVAR